MIVFDRKVHPFVQTWPAVAALLAVVGCANRAAPTTTPLTDPERLAAAAEAAREEERSRRERLAAVYEELDSAVARYDAGVESIAAGQEVEGETWLVEASSRIAAARAECAAIDGCDRDLFVEAMERLLDHQSLVLRRQAYDIRSLEEAIQADVEREPGTTPYDVATVPAETVSLDPTREIERSVALLHGADFREMIQLNGPVKAALDDWLTWMRPLLMEAWWNYQYLRPAMIPAYEESNLPEALLFAMMATETGGKVHSYSRAGAAGPLQFMRYTGKMYGLSTVDGFDMRLDPASAARANAAYLHDRFKELNNDLEMAIAAYNGGEGRMRNLHRRHKGASLWDSNVYYSLPSETRDYVPRVLAAAWLFLHPEDYGLEFPDVPSATAELVLEEEMAISELSICLGQSENADDGWFRTLRNLNPRLDPGERLAAGATLVVPTVLEPVYRERCLGGNELVAQARELHDANYPDVPEMIPYTVRRGDTLGKIASRHRCTSLRELASLNRIRPPRYTIHVGQKLRIPTCG